MKIFERKSRYVLLSNLKMRKDVRAEIRLIVKGRGVDSKTIKDTIFYEVPFDRCQDCMLNPVEFVASLFNFEIRNVTAKIRYN